MVADDLSQLSPLGRLGDGAFGPPLSDFPTIIGSVRRLLALPDRTRIHPGHGADTTVATERPHVDGWITRGW